MKAVIFIHVLYLILMKTFIVKGGTKCESKVELRAVLLSCPTKDTGCDDDDPLSQTMKFEESQILQANTKNFESLKEEKERGFPSAVKDCKRKLVITLKVKNSGKIPCDDEYIVVDHVFDPVTGGRGRLLTPVVLKLRQEQMVQMYGLQFQRVVNSDPFEEEKKGEKTCSTDPQNPTCGIAMYDGKPIPFSEGFCCSCDPHVNAKRQLSPVSQGDSFFYRDFKLISQESARVVRDEKPGAILNPKLVKLRSGNSGDSSADKKSADCGGISDPLSWDKVPNFLLELDRKIVCDRGDFLNELCKLRDDKNEVESISSESNKNKNSSRNVRYYGDEVAGGKGMADVGLDNPDLTTTAIDVDLSNANQLTDDEPGNVILLNNFVKTLNVDQTTTLDALSDIYGSVKGSRGKRENRKENKKLTLEEKLNRFVSSKRLLTNRRKRLLELSHKRFRKADESCKSGQECQTVMVPGYFQDDYVKSPPPKYFFSHDRFIIDPLESPREAINSTCKSSKELNYEDLIKETTFELPRKDELMKKMKNAQEEKMRHSSNPLQPKSEYKISGKVGNKKDRISHNDGGRVEDNDGRNEVTIQDFGNSFRKTMSFKGDKRIDLYKEIREKNLERENKEADELLMKDLQKDQKSRMNMKSFKNLFRKSESEKEINKSKIRNFFVARNRERQKMKSELKGHKEAFDIKKYLGHLKETPTGGEKYDSEERKAKENEREKGHHENQEDLKSPEVFGPEKFDVSGNQYSIPKDLAKGKENSAEVKMPKSSARIPEEVFSDVDFNVEIVRSQFPEISSHRHHPNSAEKFMKNRIKPPSATFDAKVFDLIQNANHLKNKQSSPLHYKPQQRYYIVEKDDISPRDVYLIQSDNNHFSPAKNRPHYAADSQAPSFDDSNLDDELQSNRKTYFYKKPGRRYYVPVEKYSEPEEDSGRPRSRPNYLSNLDDKVHEAQLRGKRFSELLRRYKAKDHRSEAVDENQFSRHARVRSKRSASFSFQPARGFFRSELDSRSPSEVAIHELEGCQPKRTTRNDEQTDTWTSGLAGWQFSRFKRGNLSIDANIISSLQELQSRINYPELTSGQTEIREKTTKSDSDKQRLIRSYLNAPEYVLEGADMVLKGKRQAHDQAKSEKPPESSSTSDKDVFAGEYTQGTAHCMRFGDMWYSLYMIKKPMISQSVGIQLFDKHMMGDGISQWRDLTKGKMIRVGTFLTKAEDDLPTISITFMGGKTEKIQSAIDPDNYYLLIPSHVSDTSKLNSYPQFDGGPAEYLLVQSKDISSGGECNMVGTSFEAFARQPDRCTRRRGSCLKRQPVDLWREDMEARIRGKRGKYFVENFGNVANSSVKSYTNLTGEFLALEYYGEYSSTIEIEVKADSNAIVRKGSNAQIPLVYVDGTYPKKTRIILSVLNIGLTSSYFRPRLGDCPPDLDPAWCPLEGPLVVIPPQQRHDFKLDLSGALPNGRIHVSVQVLNQVNKKIAFRKIIIKKGDRCVCAFHCKCNCIGNLVDGRICQRLSLEDYRKAGYIGSFPFRGGAAASASESILGNIHIVFLTASYALLFLGVLKGTVGIFVRRIGIAGTRIITGPRELCGYYESELQECSVLYDEYGFPVHPTTCRPVQIVPLCFEIFINFLFFFLYPLRGLWFLLLSLPCCKAMCSDCDGCCRHDEGAYDQKSSHPLLSKEPHSTCVHYNVTSVNSKRSKEEYLSYPAYKGDDDPLEEDDTEFVLQEMKRYRKK